MVHHHQFRRVEVKHLAEFLGEAGFPAGTQRILFDPNQLYAAEQRFRRILDWAEARRSFKC